ncbi:F0F1 ATP synthase subunit gamma, partial [Candidatus Uhrbacteria bacterium]|nr:F0F1 ATP synthase subunit gamma [Candidatus Uhrbacteria bacterium]
EPDPRAVLDRLLPRLLETRIYQALLESSASEHSSRMLTMRNATDNATGILDDLTFTYNQARQAGITREISEISAGKAALE